MYTTIIYIGYFTSKDMKLKKPIAFKWDEGNKDKNVQKHKVQNNESEEVFVNNAILLEDISHSQEEIRYLVYGVTDGKRQLVTSFTLRGEKLEKIRVISSRDQDRKEKGLYRKMQEEVENKK